MNITSANSLGFSYREGRLNCPLYTNGLHVENVLWQMFAGAAVQYAADALPTYIDTLAAKIRTRAEVMMKKRVCLLPMGTNFKNDQCIYLPDSYCTQLQNAFLSSLNRIAERCRNAVKAALTQGTDPTNGCYDLKVEYPILPGAEILGDLLKKGGSMAGDIIPDTFQSASI